MYGLEKVNYGSMEECAATLKQIADGITEDRQKLRQIIDGLVIEDFNTDLTTPELNDAVNGVLALVDRCIDNLNKYSIHLTKVSRTWQETDQAVSTGMKNTMQFK